MKTAWCAALLLIALPAAAEPVGEELVFEIDRYADQAASYPNMDALKREIPGARVLMRYKKLMEYDISGEDGSVSARVPHLVIGIPSGREQQLRAYARRRGFGAKSTGSKVIVEVVSPTDQKQTHHMAVPVGLMFDATGDYAVKSEFRAGKGLDGKALIDRVGLSYVATDTAKPLDRVHLTPTFRQRVTRAISRIAPGRVALGK